MMRQQMLNVLITHVYRQPRRCPPSGPGQYEFEDDKCFVRALIPDEYWNNWASTPIDYQREVDLKFPEWMREDQDFIHQVQLIHDNEENWTSLNTIFDKLFELAIEHNLIFWSDVSA